MELQVPPSTVEASTSRSPSPIPSTNNNVDSDEIIETESTPMVTESVETTSTTDNDNHYENDNGGTRLSILNKIKRKPNATQQATLPVVTDGVFSNLSAKPDTEADKEDENPPVSQDLSECNHVFIYWYSWFFFQPYETAAADAAPPYWETTIIAPGLSGDEILVEGLPVGNFFSFVWNMLGMCIIYKKKIK